MDNGSFNSESKLGHTGLIAATTLTLLHFIGACSVTGICLTAPLPSASLFLCAANSLSSFFSSSLRLLQYLKANWRRFSDDDFADWQGVPQRLLSLEEGLVSGDRLADYLCVYYICANFPCVI